MSTFGITPATGKNDLVGAINYALNNIGQGLTVNKENGQILAPGNSIPYAYAYPYLYVAFADSADGTLNFTQSSYTNRQYYGLWNTPNLTPGGSQNPAQYIWYQVQGGFGTTKGLYYQIFGQNQVQFSIDVLSPEPQGFYSEPYTLRLYQFIDPNQRGINLVETTNATNLEYSGVLTASPINLFALDNNSPNGKPAWTPAGQIQVDGADRILVNSITPDNIYYFAQLPDPVSFGDYNPVETGFNLYYIEPSSGPNTLYSPNYATTGTITLTPLTAQPTYYSTGTIAMANYTNWNPNQHTTNSSYPVYYDGIEWQPLYQPPIAGSFYSTSSFSITTATDAYVFTYNKTSHSLGVSIDPTTSSRVVLDGPGIYNVQFSTQIINSSAGELDAYVWLRQNGLDVDDTTSIATVPKKHGSINGAYIMAANFFVETTATYEYIELAYGAETTDITFNTVAAGTGPTRPSAPAIILTVDKIN